MAHFLSFMYVVKYLVMTNMYPPVNQVLYEASLG